MYNNETAHITYLTAVPAFRQYSSNLTVLPAPPQLNPIEYILCAAYTTLFIFGELGNVYVITVITKILRSKQSGKRPSRSRQIGTTGFYAPSSGLSDFASNRGLHPHQQKQRRASFWFILCLSSVDALVLGCLPLVISNIVNRTWSFGLVTCKLYLGCECFSKLLSTYILTIMSGNRFFILCHRKRSIDHILKMLSGICLIFPLIIIALIAWYADTTSVTFKFWTSMPTLTTTTNTAANIANRNFDLLNNPGPHHTSVNYAVTVSAMDVNALAAIYDEVADSSQLQSNAAPSYIKMTVHRCFFEPPPSIQDYFVFTIFTTGYLIPGILIGTFYACLLLKLGMQKRRFRGSRIHFWKITRPIILVAAFYYICWTPYWLLAVVFTHFLADEDGGSDRAYQRRLVIITMIIHLLPYVNSACNPLLYAWLNKELRRAYASAVYHRQAYGTTAARIMRLSANVTLPPAEARPQTGGCVVDEAPNVSVDRYVVSASVKQEQRRGHCEHEAHAPFLRQCTNASDVGACEEIML